jgi:hypothetical protein
MDATRIQYKQRKCAALGCSNRFTPKKATHIYCSDNCSGYMRTRRMRDQRRKEAAAK